MRIVSRDTIWHWYKWSIAPDKFIYKRGYPVTPVRNRLEHIVNGLSAVEVQASDLPTMANVELANKICPQPIIYRCMPPNVYRVNYSILATNCSYVPNWAIFGSLIILQSRNVISFDRNWTWKFLFSFLIIRLASMLSRECLENVSNGSYIVKYIVNAIQCWIVKCDYDPMIVQWRLFPNYLWLINRWRIAR